MTRGDIKRIVLSKLAGDTYFPDQQLNDLVNVAIDIMGAKTPFRQDMVAFLSVSSQREYNLPHNIVKVQTVEYNNCPLDKISYGEATNLYAFYDTTITTDNQNLGTPEKYYIRENTYTDPTLNAPDITGTTITDTTGTAPTNPSPTSTSPAPQGDPINPSISVTSPLVLGFFPIPPDTGLVIRITGAFRPPYLADDTQTPAFPLEYHNMIIDYVLSQLKETDNEDASGNRYEQKFNGKLIELEHKFLTDDTEMVEKFRDDMG